MSTDRLYCLTVLIVLSALMPFFMTPADANIPVAQNQSVTTNEDTAKVICLVATDGDGSPLTYAIVSAPLHGSITGTPPMVTYKPATNYNGPDSFTFKANDGTVDSNIATVSITVVAINDPPVAKTQSVTTRVNKSKTIVLVATDVDNDPLTYQVVGQPLDGTLSGTLPSLTYTPAANYVGSDSFTFKANDGKVDSNIATVSITVTANHSPVAQSQTVTTNEDTAKAIRLVATDADSDPLTYSLISGSSHGTFTGTLPTVTYKPVANYNGPDSFTFKANDGMADSNVATVSITVVAANDPPVAQNQSVSTNKNKAKAITLTASDVEGDPLTYQIVAQPLHGILSGTPPSVIFTPTAGYSGSDSFTFKANDGKVDSNIAKVSITVVNNAPVAQNQSATANEDTPKALTLTATDADGDPLTYQIATQPAHGKLTGTPPNVTYTPSVNYNGSDSFTFKAYDGKLYSNNATASITILAVNDPPAAKNQSVSVNRNATIPLTLVATDVDGDPLTYRIVSGPSRGTLTGTPPTVTYKPSPYYYSSDSFTFKSSDGKAESNVATVTITIVNHAPVALNQSLTTSEDTAKVITLVATDIDGDALTYMIVAQPGHGSLSGPPPSVTYTPASLYDGPDSFTFKASDGMASSNVATVSIAVTPVNDPPVAQDQNVTVIKDSSLSISLSATDPDGDPLTYQIVTQPAHGNLSGTPPNVLYTPEVKYKGLDSFTFKSSDGKAESNVATISITVDSIITTVAGNGIEGYSGEGGPATQAQLHYPWGVATDASGNLYISDNQNLRVRKVDGKSIITTFAGNGVADCWSQGPATSIGIGYPEGLASDASGNVYIADSLCHRIRKVDANGLLTTVAGSIPSCCRSDYSSGGYGGDGSLATAPGAALNYPEGVALDSLGNLYVADTNNHRIRKVDTNGIITTFAGNGSSGYSGDGGPATQAMLNHPNGVAVDTSGNLYIADYSNHCIRKVDSTGRITTIAGNGVLGYGGDGGPAIQTSLSYPSDLSLDVLGNLYIAELGYNRVRKVDRNGIITTVAGIGDIWGQYTGDGGPATQAEFDGVHRVALDTSGNLYIADTWNSRVRKVEGVFTSPNGTVTGKVTDSATSLPLSDVYVIVKSTNDLDTHTTRTDSNGTYAVSGVPPGGVTATFEKSGYIDQTISGTSIAGQTQTFNVELVPVPPGEGVITTVAGNGAVNFGGDGGIASRARLHSPMDVAFDVSGNLYIVDTDNQRIRKVDKNGIITTVAGDGNWNYGGDGGPAVQAKFWNPSGVAVDSLGSFYIADTDNQRIRKVDINGIITTVAGNGNDGYAGDNSLATQAQLNFPGDVVVDGSGNLYIADTDNHRIRMVDKNGIITTVAGNGIAGYGGDSGPAIQAKLCYPLSVAVDTLGNLYIADTDNERIRKVDKNGVITTVAGNGLRGYSGDGGLATQAAFDSPSGVVVDASGTLYIADSNNDRIRKVDANGIITTFAGSGSNGFSGDGGPATQAGLAYPWGVAVDILGNLYIADTDNQRIRKVDRSGAITTVAGGIECGDGGPATQAQLHRPTGVVTDASGNLYVADTLNHRVRKVDEGGIITTVAGTGIQGYSGDGGPAAQAKVYEPWGVAADTLGNLYIADTSNQRIRKVNKDGIISTVAGNGSYGFSGDGGPAAQARLYEPSGVAIGALGDVYIADTYNNRVRRIDPSGIITTVAGNGTYGYSGDGGPATSASLSHPDGLTLDASGNIYISDTYNHHIRKVDTNGIITTLAGYGSYGYSGDGGPAIQAHLAYPSSVVLDGSGSLYLADTVNHRIREVDRTGIITTIAGNGSPGYSGDGIPATQTKLNYPAGIAADALGNLYIADRDNNRVRKVGGVFAPTTTVITGTVTDSLTGLQLTTVMVTIKDALIASYTTQTDSNGKYTVSGFAPGNFSATFMKSGYIQKTLNGTCAIGRTQTLDIQLVAIPPLNVAITSPPDGAVIDSSPVLVTGNVSNDATVAINGLQASVSSGAFSVSVPLNEGLNSITAIATDQYNQSASQKLNVTLATKGSIAGTVTHSSTGLPLPSATVSVTDSLSHIQTVSTDGNGQYLIPGVASGAFNGMITKGGYGTYSFSGTMISGQAVTVNATLTPLLPVISTVVVSAITPSSATITWTTDQPADSRVDYGTTTSYGSSVSNSALTTTHTLLLTNLTPGTTYHLKATSKNSYGLSSSSGDVTFVTTAPPTISAVVASNITKDSATITWTTDQPADSRVDYGTTTSYGSSVIGTTLTTNHTIILSNLVPATTYHFKVTSKNDEGLSSYSTDFTFKTFTPLISLAIIAPLDGAVVNGNAVMVKGSVLNSTGNETGVIVNGALANTYGGQFVANHVVLAEGLNTLTVTATDTDGNVQTASISVSAIMPGNYIKISAIPESGISPLQTIFSLESSLSLTNATINCTGPGNVDFLPADPSGIKANMTIEGIYNCTAEVRDTTGNLYQDIMAISVLSKAEMDALLRAKWERMRAKLASGDIEGGLAPFDELAKQDYRDLFTVLSTMLPTIAEELSDIQLIEYMPNAVVYDIRTIRDGIEYSFQLLFTRDDKGLWRINSF
jgi:sugar lactone lactonase YvrE